MALFLLAGHLAGAQQKDSLVALPWQQDASYSDVTSSARTIGPAPLEHYVAGDIQGRLTGLIGGLSVIQKSGECGAPGQYAAPTMSTSRFDVMSRLFTDLVSIIDDVPVPFDQFSLDPNQIESITLIRDAADKALFGPMASNGALYIRTKKGGYNTAFNSSLDFESGSGFAGIWPEWMGGYDYAVYNNSALEASGMTPLFSAVALEGIRRADPCDIQYPNVDYRSLMMRDFKPISRVSYNANAGNSNVKYNLSFNALHDDDLLKVGPRSDYNRLNLTTSVTAKIGSWIEANASFYGLASFRRLNSGASFTSYLDVVPTAFPLTLQVAEDSEFYDPSIMKGINTIYAVSRKFPDNPYAKALESGSKTERLRSGMFNATIDIDLGFLVKGLHAKSFVNLGTFTNVTVGKNEDYIAYYWNPEDIIEAVTDHKGKKQSSKSLETKWAYQTLNMYEDLSYNLSRGRSRISAHADFFINSSASANNSAYERMMGGVASARYSYDDRYVVGLVADYVGIGRYHEGKRFGFFPAASVAWNVTNEQFLKGNRVLTSLKLFAQAGRIGDNDVYGKNYLWQGVYSYNSGMTYGPYVANSWFGNITETSSYTYISRIANHEVTWPWNDEVDLGFDATLWNCLDISYTRYDHCKKGLIRDVSSVYSQTLGYANASLYQNYSEDRYMGHEFCMRYFRDWKDFGLSIAGDAVHWDSEMVRYAGDFAIYDYQKMEGRRAGDFYGFHCLGKFQSESEIAQSPVVTADTRVGDLKYEDRNCDGIIDNNDKYCVGSTNPKIRYSLNIGLRYRKFDLTVVGTGNAFFKTDLLSSPYFNDGSGDGNYSLFLKDPMYPGTHTWDPDKVNFHDSDYWLVNGGWFKLRNVELAYTTSFRNVPWIRSVRISLRGTNLFTVTDVPYVDPEYVQAGVTVAPIMRTFTAGLKFSF